MCEHCTLQKGCFYLFTFYLFTFLVIIQLHSFTISSTGPFSISEWEGLSAAVKGGYEPGAFSHRTSLHRHRQRTLSSDGRQHHRGAWEACEFPISRSSRLLPQKVKKVKGKKVKTTNLQCAMKRTKEDQLQGSVCVCELHLLVRTPYSPKPFFCVVT